MGRREKSTILGLLAILFWSATVALARSAAERVGPITAGACVYLSAGAFLAAVFFRGKGSFERLLRLPRPYMLGCGALFVLYTFALFLALGLAATRQQAIEVGLLNYLWPALTIVFSLPILGNRASAWLVPGTIVALGGIVLVVTEGAFSWDAFVSNVVGNPAAYGLGALAGVLWALYSNLTRRWGPPEAGGGVMLFTLGTGAVFAAARLFLPESGPQGGGWSIGVAAEVAALALATASAYVFWDLAMREGDLTLVAACSYLTPFLSTVVGCLYLGIWPGASLWTGCLCIIAGSLVSWRAVRPAESVR